MVQGQPPRDERGDISKHALMIKKRLLKDHIEQLQPLHIQNMMEKIGMQVPQ
jgi:hypothetical protein